MALPQSRQAAPCPLERTLVVRFAEGYRLLTEPALSSFFDHHSFDEVRRLRLTVKPARVSVRTRSSGQPDEMQLGYHTKLRHIVVSS